MKSTIIILLLLINIPLAAQDEADSLPSRNIEVAKYTFKGIRLQNSHSIETLRKKNLNFVIGHKFGEIGSGYSNLFGLDDFSNVRLGLDYGLNDRITIGIGRSRFDKLHDVFLKYRFLDQVSGDATIPFAATAMVSMTVLGRKFTELENEIYDFSHRLSYIYQLMLARKISDKFSLQLMPMVLHQNLSKFENEDNIYFNLGGALRYRLTYTISLMAEYFYRFNDQPDLPVQTFNPITVGIDFETFSHVFSVYLTNATAMAEKQFITETTSDFWGGDIHLGFTISRVFTFR